MHRSVSFRMMRYLAERLPLLVTPRWVSTRIQSMGYEAAVRRVLTEAPRP